MGGPNKLTVTSGNGQTASIVVGTVTRSSGSALDITLNSVGGSGLASVIFTNQTFGSSTYALVSGILGWATVNKNNWVTLDASGVVSAFSAYDNDTWGTGKNTNVTLSNTTAYTGETNSIRFDTNADVTLKLGTTTLKSGGILVGTDVGAHTVTITGGSIESTAALGKEVIIHQNNTLGDLIIESSIGANWGPSSLIKAGAGRLILRGNNTYNGTTSLLEGAIIADSATAFGSLGILNLGSSPGSYIDLNGYSFTVRTITSAVNHAGTALAQAGLIPYLTNSKAGTNSTLTINYTTGTPTTSITGSPLGL